MHHGGCFTLIPKLIDQLTRTKAVGAELEMKVSTR